MIKLISAIYKKPGLSNKEFCKYWKETHGPLAARVIPGLVKYTQNHLVQIPGAKYECDGFAEIWFDSLEAYERFLAWRQTGESKELLNDADKFIDKGKTTMYVVEEHIIV